MWIRMIKLVFVIFSSLFPFSGASSTMADDMRGESIEILRSDSNGMVLRFFPPELEMWQKAVGGISYTVLESEGCGFTLEEARPRIPVFAFMVGIPRDSEVFARVIDYEKVSLKVGTILPNPIMEVDEDRFDFTTRFEIDRDFYARAAPYPGELVSIKPLGWVRQNRTASLRIAPFQYNPATGELVSFKRIEVEISFSNPQPLAVTVPAEPEPLLSSKLLNYDEARYLVKKAARQIMRKKGSGEGGYRIMVDADGIYHIDGRDLQKAGIDIKGIDPRTIRITNRGRELPILVKGEEDGSFDDGDFIEFYGRYNRATIRDRAPDIYKDPYSDRNVYWMSWGRGPGIRLASEAGRIVETDPLKFNSPTAYEFTVHAEEDLHWDRLGRIKELSDHWFWGSITGGNLRSFRLHLPSPDRGSFLPVTVTTMMRGRSYPDGGPDHHALIYLNDLLVADETWDGQQLCRSHGQGPWAQGLKEGENTLTIILPGDAAKSAGPMDVVYLNWVEVEYPRLYQAEDDYIEFSKPKESPFGLYNFVIKGFSEPDIEVYKKDVSKIGDIRIEHVGLGKEAGRYQVVFQDEITSDHVEYVALLRSKKRKPLLIEKDEPSVLRSPENSADYILIAPEVFLETSQELVDHRRSQGLNAQAVRLQDIYDEFNYGIPNPEAIRDFLKFAFENWADPPKFVLLVGDGSWDHKGPSGREGNFIPPYPSYTEKWGWTAADYLYGCVSGSDLLPDLFVGRLPVSNKAELEAVIEKIILYERSPELGGWRRDLLFIGGIGEVFRTQSEQLITELVPPGFNPVRLYAYGDSPEEKPYSGGTQDLIDRLNEGVILVNFLGHGGGAIWSDANLFRLEDIQWLNNFNRLPFVISLTCFTAAFDNPYRSSLGEELLRAENKGAVAVLGSTGLGWLWHDYYLARSLIPSLLKGERLTLGEVLAAAKTDFLAKYSGSIAESMVKQYTLLGDPATRLGVPAKGVELRIVGRKSLSPGDSLVVEGRVEAPSGTAEIELFDGAGRRVGTSVVPVIEGRFSGNLILPDTTSIGQGEVRIYVTDGKKTDWLGAVNFSVLRPFIGSISLRPPSPSVSDSLWVSVEVENPDGVEELICHFSTGDSIKMVSTGVQNRFVTESPLVGLSPGEIKFYFSLTDEVSSVFTSKDFVFKVNVGPNLTVDDIFLTGQEEVQLAARISNRGDTRADSARIVFFLESRPRAMIGETSISGLDPGRSAVCTIPADLPGGVQTITVEINPLTEGKDMEVYSEQVLVDMFNITGPQTINVDGAFTVTIPSGVSGAVLKVGAVGPVFLDDQPDFTPLSLPGYPDGVVYEATPINRPLKIGQDSLLVGFKVDLPDSLLERENVVIARWQEEGGKWISLGRLVGPSSISASSSRFGRFTVLRDDDRLPPVIDVAVEDQYYMDGGYISADPKISAVVGDANGINLDEIRVFLDGLPVDPQLLRISSYEGNSVSINFSPDLTRGHHTVRFVAKDASGNAAQKIMDFDVIQGTELVVLGNFPNPFSDETIFAFRIDGNPAQKLSLKIYSISGRLVRTFDDVTDDYGSPLWASGYHEVRWDGTNEGGDRLANGLYFCKLKAILDNGEVMERTLKVARIR